MHHKINYKKQLVEFHYAGKHANHVTISAQGFLTFSHFFLMIFRH